MTRGEHTPGIVDLLPCPFCGAHLHVMSEAQGYFHDKRNCPLSDFHMEADGYSEERWNTRPEAADLISELVGALENFCQAAEYWAGCDEGGSPDAASSEIMSSGGAWPAEAYDRARAALLKARGGAE